MDLDQEAEALAALGHPARLAVFRMLARRMPQGVRPSELAAALDLKPNTLSVYVSTLARAGLVTSHREGRSVFYRIGLERFSRLASYLVLDCCRGRPELCVPLAAQALRGGDVRPDPRSTHETPDLHPTSARGTPMTDRAFNVLFICTGNSARSIFAETVLRALGGDKFVAYSAGTRPYSELNPYALDVLNQLGHETSGLRAKNISEFQTEDAPKMDFVFTVCDSAANEECPPWPGQPITAHWGMPDPVKAEGTDGEKALAFRQAYHTVRARLSGFVELPIDSLDRISLQKRLDDIGQLDAGAIGTPA